MSSVQTFAGSFAGSVAVRTNGSPPTQVQSAPAPAPAPTQVQVRPSSEEIAAEFARIVQEARGGPKPTTTLPEGMHWASVNGNWIRRHNPHTLPEDMRRPKPMSGLIKRKDGTLALRKSRK